jgi:YesN/AraC family two-component response regulator
MEKHRDEKDENKLDPDEKHMPYHYLDSIDGDTCRVAFCEWFDEKSKIWNYEMHAHPFIELIYFLEGKADISDADQTKALSLFELVVYPAGVPHQEYLDTRYHQAIICLNILCDSQMTYPRLFKLKDEHGTLRWIMKRIHSEYHNPGEYHDEIMTDLLHLLLSSMKKIAKEIHSTENNIPDKCMQYIQEHFAEDIDMKKLTGETYVSASYLNRVFKRKFGNSPILYLNLYRMEVAKEMLVQTNDKITQIAQYVGLDDSKHFAKVFKKTTGFTPAAYRKEFSTNS